MWASDRYLFESLAKQCGSRYLAVWFLAKGSRKLASTLPPGVIESKLITWVLTGAQPEIEAYLLKRQDSYIEMKNLSNMVDYVEDESIRNCVILSYKHSVKNHHLLYEYTDGMPEADRTRVRILTRMAWYD